MDVRASVQNREMGRRAVASSSCATETALTRAIPKNPRCAGEALLASHAVAITAAAEAGGRSAKTGLGGWSQGTAGQGTVGKMRNPTRWFL